MAAGCLVLFARPTVDMSDYPYLDGFSGLVWDSLEEMSEMCYWYRGNLNGMDKQAVGLRHMAMRYLNPRAIARYVLMHVSRNM